MKLHYLFLLVLLPFINIKAQSVLELDFIILINEKVILSGINDLKVEVMKKNGNVKSFNVYYHPGSLKLDISKEIIFNDKIDLTYLKFDYYDPDKQQSISFKIELEENWFLDYYAVLNIYHLSCKKFKKRFQPLSKERNYTFEVDSPSYTFKRL